MLGGCGLKNVLPTTPVLSPTERAAFEAPARAVVTYTGEPRVAWPVVPLQVWGLRYALDIVLESDDPNWIMHEYARIDLPSGPLWIAKDASPDGLQTITADVPDIRTWVPEVPVPRREGKVVVSDRSTAVDADIALAYTNPRGDAVALRYRGPVPTKAAKPRNGNTMGHSRQSLAALLDLYLYQPGGRVEMTVGGQTRQIRKLLGLYPMKFLLAQTQGGFAIASYRQTGAEGGFTLERPGPGHAADWPTEAVESWRWEADQQWIRRDGPVTTLRYHFVDGELDQAQVWQAGDSVRPIVNLAFRPALPDLRRPFAGETVSRFAVDLNDQPGHGVGEVRCRWEGDDVRVQIRPTEPRWFADRPIDSRIRYEAGAASVESARVGESPPPR